MCLEMTLGFRENYTWGGRMHLVSRLQMARTGVIHDSASRG